MAQSHDYNTERRDFLKSALRALSLGFIALLSGVLAMRDRRTPESASACMLRSPCRTCPNVATCTDPKARASIRDTVPQKRVTNGE